MDVDERELNGQHDERREAVQDSASTMPQFDEKGNRRQGTTR